MTSTLDVMSRRIQCLVNHPASLVWDLPTLLLFDKQSAQRIEVKKVGPRFYARTREHRDASLAVVILVGVCVALAAAAHRIHDEGRSVKTGGVTANVLLDIQSV